MMKLLSICILVVVASVTIVRAARPGRPYRAGGMNGNSLSPDANNQAMGDPMNPNPMQDPDAGGPMKDAPPSNNAPPRRGRGRGRRRPAMGGHSTSSTTSTTKTPSTQSSDSSMDPIRHTEHYDEKHSSSHDMMSMPMSTTTSTSTTTRSPPMEHQSPTTPKQEMNMFPDLDTVEQLQKKQAEEHEKIIAVYKSFKDWVDYLRNSIKGGTLNPVLTRRILEDIRAYQQVIMSPHPRKPYSPPHPCDPYRDVWCPEPMGSMMNEPSIYKSTRQNRFHPSPRLMIV